MNAPSRARAYPTRVFGSQQQQIMTLLDMKPLFCYTISATYFRLPFILAQRARRTVLKFRYKEPSLSTTPTGLPRG